MRIRLTHIDGKLPNLALMRLAAWHRAHGDEVVLTRSLDRMQFEGDYDRASSSISPRPRRMRGSDRSA